MHQFQLISTTVLILCLSVSHGGKVLVFPVDGSHWVNMNIIVEELHSRGHSVTVVRASDSWYIKEASPFYTSITTDVASGFDEEFIKVFVSRLLEIQREGKSAWVHFKLEMEILQKSWEMNEKLNKMVIHIFENKELIQSLRDTKYDLFLTDPALGGGGVFLAHYLGLPLVYNVRWTVNGEGHSAIAPTPLSYVPLLGTKLTDSMNFLQRLVNVLFIGIYQLEILYLSPTYSDLVHRYFGPEVDYFSLFQAADLWLMRVDFVFEFPRPTMPNVVYMGGFQCKPAKPLPQDLEDFVQSSGEHGVVIMSLGTLIAELPHDLSDEIAAAFAQLPQKVIWRYKGRRPATLGNNTLLVDWMPQNDLLGHPKTRVFVAHGGTNGIQEAIYHGVPILGMPLIFDQPDNVVRIEARGAGKTVDIFTMNREIFLQALQEVLFEPSYKVNMQRLSRLHRDTPMKPLDLAMFWIEFVMRHKGAAHLRTESYRMPWYSYHSVDVVVFLLTVTLFSMLIFAATIRCCFRVCFRRKVKHE